MTHPLNAATSIVTIPVALNGDGFHELVRGAASGDGEVLDRAGVHAGSAGGAVAMTSKLVIRAA